MEKRFITEEDVERYGQYLAECEKSRATIQKYQYYLTLFQRYVAGRELKKKQVVQWKEDMKRCLAAVTVNGAISALNGFFRYKGWDNYTTKFYKIGRQIFCPEQKELEKWEYERLVNGARSQGDERMAMVMQTIAATGIRVSELPYITAEAVRVGASEIACKGRIRTIILTAKLCRALQQYMEPRGIVSGPIFITRSGRPMDRSNIWRAMKRLGESCGVAGTKIFPHNLRHLFARTYYNQEKDLSKLADILGHSSINTTRIYTMESGKQHARQLEKLDLLVKDNRMCLLLYS